MQGGHITISRANFEPMGTAALLRRYTSPEDPWNNLGARDDERESLENHVHARLISELHHVD